MSLDRTLWGVASPVSKHRKTKSQPTNWPTIERPCKICGRGALAKFHPDTHAAWLAAEKDSIEYRISQMALRGLVCDNCATAREMFIDSKDTLGAVALELERTNENGATPLTDEQQEKLRLRLKDQLRRYMDALRRMNGAAHAYWDDRWPDLLWDTPKATWRFLAAFAKFFHQAGKTREQQEAEMLQWLQKRQSETV